MDNIGLYIHIPFCASKCPYCDFYSYRSEESERAKYVTAVLREIRAKKQQFNCKADTLYIGGGTPTVLRTSELCEIVKTAKECFSLNGAEITVECNPHTYETGLFKELFKVGVNRISLGLQSANDSERKLLGRHSGRKEIESVISEIKEAGIENISLDVMIGVPNQTLDSLKSTLDFCISRNVKHISAYILKLEENTPFYKFRDRYSFPDDDATADMYLFMCDYLEKNGFYQYEVSNFSKKGFESKHNLKYWHCEEYLGLGPAAHSYVDGKRYFYDRDTEKFILGCDPRYDCDGGSFEEYAMLRLRLCDGLNLSEIKEKFGIEFSPEKLSRIATFQKNGLLNFDSNTISLTPKGFLVSNSLISDLIY